MFKEPVEILPNVSYTACATLKVSDENNKVGRRKQSVSVRQETHQLHVFTELFLLPGLRLTLRHKRVEESDAGVGDRDQDDVSVFQLAWEQQRYVGGGRADPRDHLLHLGTLKQPDLRLLGRLDH